MQIRVVYTHTDSVIAAVIARWIAEEGPFSSITLEPTIVQTPADVLTLPILTVPTVVLDYTARETISTALEDHFGDTAMVIVMSREAVYRRQRIYGRVLPSDYTAAYASFAAAVGFQSAAVLSDLSQSMLTFSEMLVADYPETFNSVYYLIGGGYDYVDRFVGQTVKFQGLTFLAVSLPETQTGYLVEALHTHKMYRTGLAILVADRSGLGLAGVDGCDGVVGVADQAAALGDNYEQEEYGVFSDQIGTILAAKVSDIDSLSRYLRSSYGPYSRNTTQVLFNIQSHSRLIVATSASSVRFSTILFPGNTHAFPQSSKSSIPISVNYNGTSADGSVLASMSVVMAGVKLAFEEANSSSSILANFRLEERSEAFATVSFEAGFARKQIELARGRLGIAYIPFPTSGSVQGTYLTFRSLNISMPMTSGTNSDTLSSKAAFPLFVRVTLPNSYFAMVIARMFKFYGWTKCAFLYANDPYGTNLYAAFMNISASQGITITNPEALRAIPSVFNSSNVGLLQEPLAAIRGHSARIVVIVSYFNEVVLEKLYDMGARAGDYLFVFTFAMTPDLFVGTTASYKKRREIAKGSLQFSQKTFYGLEGERIRQALISRSGFTYYANTCFFYDSTKLLILALDYLIHRGMDFETPGVLVKAMRETVFTGCSGMVQIDPDNNDRSPTQFDVVNFSYDLETEQWNITYVGVYNPFSTLMFNFTKPVHWPDSSKKFADEKPRDLDCPFFKDQVQEFPPGKTIGFALCACLAVVTGIVTFLIWKRWWDVDITILSTDSSISLEDVLVLANILFDFFQFSAMGPSLVQISSFLVTLSSSTSLNLEDLMNLTKGVYWHMLDGVLGLIGVWGFLCLYTFGRLEERLAGWCLCRSIAAWAELLMPTLGNILFLPIISTLLSVFLCYQSTAPAFQASFLVKDCYQSCWQGSHVAYVVSAAAALMVYTPLAIFSRPLWQELQGNLHVKARPLYLMVKSILQIFIIVLALTLKKEQPLVHGVVFTVILTIYCLFLLRFRPYNYER